MNKSIKHVWFDMDGTLTVHDEDFKKAHTELKYKTYADVLKRQVTQDLKNEYDELYLKHGSNSAVFTSLGKPSNYWMRFFEQLDQDRFYKPLPDIYETIDRLRKIVPVSIFTNSGSKNMIKTLQKVKVEINWFTYVISGDDVENRKPSADGFHKIIELSKVNPEQIVYVGDRVSVDIIPAKKVGIQTCLLYDESPEADLCFPSMPLLLSIFENRS